jgi:small subunit ribosomal protein S20
LGRNYRNTGEYNVGHSLSAKKRQRQNVAEHERNRHRRSEVKTLLRSFKDAVAEGDASKAQTAFRDYVKTVDQVAANGTIHRNAAARKKARAQRRLNALAAPAK